MEENKNANENNSDSVSSRAIAGLPNEVCKIILRNLDCRSLFRCRKVSKNMKSLADEVLKENSSLWKSTWTPETFGDLLKRTKGIRFSTAEQVTTFLSEMDGIVWNPFPNGTAIFCPNPHIRADVPIQEEYDAFYDAFVCLVSVYHEEISTLVYCFKKTLSHLQLYAQLECILMLKNLKHLTIFSEGCDLEGETLQEFLRIDQDRPFAPAPLSKVTELQIFGFYNHISPYLTHVLCAAVNSSCKRLLIDAADSANLLPYTLKGEGTNPFDFPKLEKAKVSALLIFDDWDTLYFLRRHGLREVGFELTSPSTEGVQQLMKLLEGSASNLQLLLLLMNRDELENLGNPEMNLVEGEQPQFKKMKHLILDYHNILNWRNLLPYFKGRFPNLKKLTIHVKQEDQEPKTPQEFCMDVMDLWKDLPSSLYVIHVPYFFWRLDRTGKFLENTFLNTEN